ncbi:MAG: hypothetical protein U0Q22_02130 [Acidimicrobiales bacterium]
MTLRLLVVCTANQCRSPLGEVLARRRLDLAGIEAEVRSAGTQAIAGVPATDLTVKAARRLDLDLSGHASRPVDAELLEWADVVVTMERHHVIELVTQHDAPLATTFTLPELAALVAAGEPREDDETVAAWLARIAAERSVASVMGGGSPAGEIDDPTGGSLRKHRDAAQRIDEALGTIVGGLGAGG